MCSEGFEISWINSSVKLLLFDLVDNASTDRDSLYYRESLVQITRPACHLGPFSAHQRNATQWRFAGGLIAIRFRTLTGQSMWSFKGATFACHVCREIGLRLEMHLKSMPDYLCISLFIIHFISEDLLSIMVLLCPFNNSSHFGTPLPVENASIMSSVDGTWCNLSL